MILGYFTNKPLCLGPRFWGQFSGYICIAAKISAQKFFLVAAIYEHLVGGLVKTPYSPSPPIRIYFILIFWR